MKSISNSLRFLSGAKNPKLFTSALPGFRAFALCLLFCSIALFAGSAHAVSFYPAVNYAVGNSPESVTTGDFNGDGKVDLAVANEASHNVSILLGNGDVTFQTAVNYGAGSYSYPRSVTTGDFNGDGKADLAVANSGPNNVSILLGNGDGTFQTAVYYAVGDSPLSVTTGDFNGDGKADLAVANANEASSNVSILLGNGDGTFQGAVYYAVGTEPYSVTTGDFNGDGKVDLAVANFHSNNVSILLGSGDGTFQSAVYYAVGSYPFSVTTGDFNGDGKVDLAAANYSSGNVGILLGNGNGTFQSAVYYAVGSYPFSVTTGDFNGDGKTDIAAANYISHNVSILLGNGNGTFQGAVNYGAGSYGYPWSVTTGDFNGDGKADLAVANSGSNNVSILINSGRTLTVSKSGTGSGIVTSSPSGISCGADCSEIYSYNTSVTLTATPDTGSIFTGWSGDADCSDGQVTMNANKTCTATFLSGSAFYSAGNYGVGTKPFSVTTGDFNGDGKVDLAVANYSSSNVSILLGNGNGTFQAAVNYGAGTGPVSATTGDFNGDGKVDLAVANYGSSNVSILLGNGNGTFQAAVNYAVGSYPYSVTTGDFNRDGKTDLAVANGGSSNVSILLGNGNGTFQATVNYAVGSYPESVTIGDFNGDGKADLAVANSGSANVSILLGNGNGTFQAAVNYGAGTTPASVTIGDFNSDGKADLAVANYSSSNVSILLGNGNGTFQTAVNYGAGTKPYSVTTGDFNGDGKVDLAEANGDSNNVSILINSGPVALTVSKSGTGSGTITSSPSGISCGSDCNEVYDDGTLVTLTATPDTGSTFTGWSGDADCSDGQVTMNANKTKTCIATFTLNTYTLTVTKTGTGSGTVTSSPLGIDCGTDCTETYALGTPVILTATPDTGSTFSGWSGDADCSDGQVTMDANKTCTATFLQHALSFASAVNYAVGNSPKSVTIGDFNGDGKLDLAVANGNSVNVSILLGNGNGTFQTAVNYGVGTAYSTAYSVTTGDFNGDGKADLAVANGDSGVSILLGNGDGTFQTVVNYGAGTNTRSVTTGDFNGDGKVDLAVANSSSNNVSILLGNGDGTFQTAVNYGAGTSPYSVTTGDFNGDGKADLAVANRSSNTVSILLGNGNGTFQTAVNYGVGSLPFSVNTGDFNGDGKVDLAVANSGSSNVSILLGNGNGTFQTAVNYGAGTNPASVTTGDFNGDGKADLAVANGGSNNVSILLGNGDGTLIVVKAGTGSGAVTSSPSGISCGADCSEAYNYNTNVTLTATPDTGSTFAGWSGDADCSDGSVTMSADKTCTATFTLPVDTTAPTTTASPTGGTYGSAKSVTLTCSDGTGLGCANIYYTTDGSTPTTSSNVYSGAINISVTTTLKFFAKDNANNNESVKTKTYTIDSGIIEINSCQSLSISGATYVLTQNLSSSANCLTLDANNITLDCNGFGIHGDHSPDTYGIFASGTSCHTIKNCVVSGYTVGVFMYDSSNNYLLNITSYNNDYSGLLFNYFYDSTLTNIASYDNLGDVVMDTASGNVLSNIRTWNSMYGFSVFFSSGNTFTNITSVNNEHGIVMGASYLNTITDSRACSGEGFYFYLDTYYNTGLNNKGSVTDIGGNPGFLSTECPTGPIIINSGATYTTSTSVTLTLTCTDAGGCSQMQFSNDNSTWSTAEAYATSKLWTLISGDGTKTVYVKFKDSAGNWSSAYSDTIILDTAAPTTTASPAGGTYGSSQSVTLTCSDGSGSGCANIYYRIGGGCSPITLYSGAINIASSTDLRFYSTDNAGNSESVKTETYAITYNLAVNKSGLGSVTSTSPADVIIDCGDICGGNYNPGTLVTLVATPDSGYTFTGWSGACTGTGTCEITMDANKDVTATFAGIPNISSSPTSLDFGSVNINTTSPSQTVTVSNTGTAGLHIGTAAITGDYIKQVDICSGNTVAPTLNCQIQIAFSPASAGAKAGTLSIPSDDPDTLTLNISLSGTGISQYTLTVGKTGTGSGTVTATGINCGADCSEVYTSGTTVTLSPAPDTGSTFTGWTGCDSVSGNTCDITMNSDKTITAAFIPSALYVVWADDTYGNNEIFLKKSTDNGATWVFQRLTTNTGNSQFPAVAVSGNNVYAVWQDDTYGPAGVPEIFMKRSTDSGATWQFQRITTNTGSSFTPDVVASGNNVYVVWEDNTYGNAEIFLKKSIDGGNTWTFQRLTNNAGQSMNPSVAVVGANVYVVWQDDTYGPAGVPEIFLKKSTDSGNTWAFQRLTTNTGNSQVPAIAVNGNDVYVVWQDDTYGNNEIFLKKSTDGGNTWVFQRLTTNTGNSQVPAIAVNGNDVYVVWEDDTYGPTGVPEIFLKRSTDSGATWQFQRLTTNTGVSMNPALRVNGTDVYAVWQDDTYGPTGVPEIFMKRSTDSGATWQFQRLTTNTGISAMPAMAR